MAIIYSHYENKVEHVWYESSNVLYSQCFDNPGREKPLKVTFKNGATYLYEGVLMEDYSSFRNAESQGKALVVIKKKYPCKRLADTDLAELEVLRETFQKTSSDIQEKAGNLTYRLQIDDIKGDFKLYYADRLIYEGIEGQVSVIKLLSSLGINVIIEDITDKQNNNE